MNARTLAQLAIAVLAAALLAVAIQRVWDDCRASGHSRLYCSRLVMR